MNINSAFPSNYLKASDLGDAQPVVTIDRVEVEGIGKNKEQKPVIYFQGKEKGVVLNKTNAKKIAELLGSTDTDDWIGQRIRLFATSTEFAGETVECIRVKAAGNGKPAAAAQAKPKPAPALEPDAYVDPDDDVVPF